MPNTPLKISFVYDDSLDGSEGVAQYVKTLGGWLSSRGHQVSYFAGETKAKQFAGGKIYSLAKNIQVTYNGNKLSMPLISSKKDIKTALSEARPDVLHIQMPHSPLMASRVIANKAEDTAVVGTFHVYPVSSLVIHGSRILKLIYGTGLKKIDAVFSVSEPAQQFAKKAFGISSDLSPNMVDIARFKRPQVKKTNDIVFLGRLVERKGCNLLLKAFAEVQKTHKDIKLIVAGSGHEREKLENLAKKLNISKNVNFLGFVSEEKKAELFASAKIACFPSLGGESFGIVLIEAMASGAGVVIGGDNEGYSSVLENNQNVLFDPRDINNFASTLSGLLDNDKKAKELHNWQQQLIKKYDVNTVGKQIENAYRRIIAKKKNKRHN